MGGATVRGLAVPHCVSLGQVVALGLKPKDVWAATIKVFLFAALGDILPWCWFFLVLLLFPLTQGGGALSRVMALLTYIL